MRVLNAVQRFLLLLLLIPVVAICLDTLLRVFNAQEDNAIVSAVRSVANVFLIEPFKTVFRKQSYLQDAAVALVAIGMIALLIVFVFRGLRSLASAAPPKKHSQPAPAKRRTTETSAKKDKPSETSETSEKSEKSSGATAGAAADKDTQSTSG